MGHLIEDVQIRFKQTSSSLGVWILRVFSGLFVGLAFSLIGQEFFGYGMFAFWFVILALAGAFVRVSRRWKVIGIIIFNLVFVLVGLLLRMYVLVAPGT